jgi:PAS domain S-box-containing protein
MSMDPMELHMGLLVTAMMLGFGIFSHIIISQRKVAEHNAEKNSHRYRGLFESMMNGFALHQIHLDGKGQPDDYIFLEINPAFERMTGLQKTKICGRKVTEVMTEIVNNSFDWIGIYGKVALKNEKIQFEQYSQQLGKWFSITAYSPVPGQFATIFEDITERKNIERVIMENQDRMDLVFNSIQAGILVIDRETHFITYANKAAAKMMGATPDNIMDRLCHKYICPAEKGKCPITDLGQSVDNSEKCVLTVTGAKVPILKTVVEGELAGRKVLIESFVDITERKKLEFQNELKARMLDAVNDSVIVHDLEGNLVYFNDAASRTRGLERDQMARINVLQSALPEIRERQSDIMRSLLERGEIIFETRGHNDDRGYYDAEVKAKIIELDGEKHVMSVARDISARKKAEEETRFSNAIMSTQQDVSIDGILVVDDNARIVSYNRRFVELWGLPEVLVAQRDDRPVLEFVTNTTADPEAFIAKVRDLYSNKQEVSHEEIVLKNGRVFDRYTSPMNGKDGRYYGRMWIFRDITERNNDESRLRQLTTAVEQSPSVIVITDRQGNIEYVNPAFTTATGYESAEVVGKNPRILKSGEMLSEGYRQLWNTILSGKEWRGEFHNKKKNGECYWEQATIGPIKNPDGSFDRFIAIKEVITERKEAQAKERALYLISQASASNMLLTELYSSIHQILGDLLNVNNFYIAVYNRANDTLEFPYFMDEQDLRPEPRKLNKGLTEYILREGVSLLASSEKQKEMIDNGEVKIEGTPPLDWLGVPLKIQGNICGALVIQTYDPLVRYGIKEKEILEYVSDHVAMAIEKAQDREALINSEERYRELIENQGEGVAVADMNDVFTFVNPAAEEIFGVPRGSLVGRNLNHFLSPHQMSVIKVQNNLRAQGEKTSYELVITRPDGSLRTILVTASPQYRKGRMEGTFGVFRDISDLKAAEEELKASEAINRTMVESAGRAGEAIVLIQDTPAVKLACIISNQETVRITGYSQDELIRMSWLDLVHPDYKEQTQQRTQARIQGQDMPGIYEIKLVSRYGNIIPVEFTGSHVRNQGKPAMVGFFREITERKRAEAEREKLIAELQEALNRIKTLKGLIPICSSCKKIRNDGGYWQQVEEYVAEHTEADFSHGLCDECAHKLYPQYFNDKKNRTEGEEIG